jgi:hypothetical protein
MVTIPIMNEIEATFKVAPVTLRTGAENANIRFMNPRPKNEM